MLRRTVRTVGSHLQEVWAGRSALGPFLLLSNIGRDISSFASQLERSPVTSEDSANKQHATIADTKTDQHPSEAKQPVAPAVAKPDPTPSHHQYEITCNKKRDWIDKLTIGLEGFGLFVLIVYTIFTGLMYFSNKKAADAAKSAADTAHDTLTESHKSFVIDQRPYLVVSESPAFINLPLAANKPIQANVTIKNIGRTPAIQEATNIKLFSYHALPNSKDSTTNAERLKNYISSLEAAFTEIRQKNEAARETLVRFKDFSAGQDVAPGNQFFTTSQEPILLSVPELPLVKTGERTLIYIGITSYTDAYEGSYRTEFCYSYFGADPKVWHICDSHNTIR